MFANNFALKDLLRVGAFFDRFAVLTAFCTACSAEVKLASATKGLSTPEILSIVSKNWF